jgi:hypothetical protein
MGDYFRLTAAASCQYFIPATCSSDCVNILLGYERKLDFEACSVYSANQTVTAIQTAINSYNSINNSVANFMLPMNPASPSCGDAYPYISVRYNDASDDESTEYLINSVSEHDFLDTLYRRGALSAISSIHLYLPLLHSRSSMGLDATYLWNFVVSYKNVAQVGLPTVVEY